MRLRSKYGIGRIHAAKTGQSCPESVGHASVFCSVFRPFTPVKPPKEARKIENSIFFESEYFDGIVARPAMQKEVCIDDAKLRQDWHIMSGFRLAERVSRGLFSCQIISTALLAGKIDARGNTGHATWQHGGLRGHRARAHRPQQNEGQQCLLFCFDGLLSLIVASCEYAVDHKPTDQQSSGKGERRRL